MKLTHGALLLAAACLPSAGWAAPDAAAVLAAAEAAGRRAKDVTATMRLTIIEPGGARAERELRLWQKGTDHRMAKFVAPARLRGVGLLSKREAGETDASVYLYLPAFGRVRRVVGRARGDSFFGTDFTQDDLSRLTYSDRFTPRVTGEDAAHVTLELTPKVPEDEPHHHLVLTVRKEDHVVAGVDAFDKADGGPSRRLTATDVKRHGEQALAHRIEAKDMATGRRTEAVIEDVQVDTGLEDDFFSKRYLQRAPR